MQTEIDRGPNLTPYGTMAGFGSRKVTRGRDGMDLAPPACPCVMVATEGRGMVVIDGDIAGRDAAASYLTQGQGPIAATIGDNPMAPEPGQPFCRAT